jgi:hypothetical protein
MIRKTYNQEIDNLIEKLMNPWDSGPDCGGEMVVGADVARDAAMKIYEMFVELEQFEAQHYNDQING